MAIDTRLTLHRLTGPGKVLVGLTAKAGRRRTIWLRVYKNKLVFTFRNSANPAGRKYSKFSLTPVSARVMAHLIMAVEMRRGWCGRHFYIRQAVRDKNTRLISVRSRQVKKYDYQRSNRKSTH